MVEAILFDLGNTLAAYYDAHEFPLILEQCIANAARRLESQGHGLPPAALIAERVAAENFEAPDLRVRPLEQRLGRIFGAATPDAVRQFMEPIFQISRVYDDTIPTLLMLKERGLKIGVVSNTPWGNPANLWREELQRLGIEERIDASIFCDEVGWRKPAEPIFRLALQRLNSSVEKTLFVGDDPHWDIEGPRRIGMRAVLMDRKAAHPGANVIGSLPELLLWLD